MIRLDAEAAGRALFAETVVSPLFSWEEQPLYFRDLMRTRAVRVAAAAIHMSEPPDEDPPPLEDPDEDDEEENSPIGDPPDAA